MSGQLQMFLEESDYQDPFESGFRPGFGSEMVVSLTDNLLWIKDGEYVPVKSPGPLCSF